MLLLCVVDATWFIANRGVDLAYCRWPDLGQVEHPEPTGSCEVCGDPSYDFGRFCSSACQMSRVSGFEVWGLTREVTR